MSDAIALRGVTKTFGDLTAVRDLDLSVPAGAVYGLIGPNGAGKTTTIRMIMSILFPDRGEVSVLGFRSALEAKDRIGYLPEERGVYRKMKVGAFLAFIARLKGRDDPGLRKRIREWLERLGLGEVEGKRCEELSKGMQQKVQFIATILHDPELLILDEPFSGLDPVNMRLLRDLVLEQHRAGKTLIFSTHVMTQAEQICDHVIMINRGEKVLDESIAGIRRRFDPKTILFEPIDTAADLGAIRDLAGVRDVAGSDGLRELSLEDGADPATIMREALALAPAARIEIKRPSLEDVFVQLVTGDGGGSQEARDLRASLRADAPAEASR